MSDPQASANLPASTRPSCPPRRGRFWLIIAVVALIAGGIGAMLGKGHDYHHRAFMAAPMLLGSPGNAADAEEDAAWMARQFARHIGATEEQKTKMNVIAVAVAKDVQPLRARMKALHGKAIELLRQPAVARDEIEKLRAEHMAIGEEISKRIAQAVGDMADVLTFEQRKGLADDISYIARRWERKHG